MNTMCRNIIEKSVIGILIYTGKRFVDHCFFSEKNEKKEKEARQISNIIDKDIKSVPLKEIIDKNEEAPRRDLFAEGELHVICAQTGVRKSLGGVQMEFAIAGGKNSEHYAEIKRIFGNS